MFDLPINSAGVIILNIHLELGRSPTQVYHDQSPQDDCLHITKRVACMSGKQANGNYVPSYSRKIQGFQLALQVMKKLYVLYMYMYIQYMLFPLPYAHLMYSSLQSSYHAKSYIHKYIRSFIIHIHVQNHHTYTCTKYCMLCICTCTQLAVYLFPTTSEASLDSI